MVKKSEIKALVAAFARKLNAEGAPIPTQQRIHDAFQRKLDLMVKNNPDVFPGGRIIPEFFEGLERAARRQNVKRIVRGPGVDY